MSLEPDLGDNAPACPECGATGQHYVFCSHRDNETPQLEQFFARDSAGDEVPPDTDGSSGDCEPDESMDGDFDSAMTSAGLGTDEDYGAGTHDWERGE